MTLRATILFLLVVLPAAESAADDRGASVAGTVSATNMESNTSWSVAGSFEYRVNRVAGFEIEVTAVPRMKAAFPPVPSPLLSASSVTFPTIPIIFPPPRFENQRRRAVFLTNNVRVHIPTTIDRLDPYFVAGGGIASVRRTADLVYIQGPLPLAPAAPGATVISIRPIVQPFKSSSVDLALTLGGGVSVRAMSHLWIEGDLRLFRLLGDDDRNVGRFGVGARYRF